MKISHLLTMLALPLAGAVCAHAQLTPISFQQGVANAFSGGSAYTGTRDLTLNAGAATLNYGALTGVSFSSTSYAGLLRFDLSSFSGTVSAVENVKLRLAVRNVAQTAGLNVKVSVYDLNVANADWVQGNKAGAAATVGESAYGFKHKGAEGEENTPWASGGAFASSDYGDTALGAYDFVSVASGTTFIEIDLPSSVIAGWINNPSSNAGLVIISNNPVAFSFYSSEYATATFRPELKFDYTLGPPVPEPATTAIVFGVVTLAGASFLRRRHNSVK